MSKRGDLPRRLGDILTPSLGKIAGSEEARAYAAWTRAVGEPVARGTRPKSFHRGQLTVECASSVWANELTYLGPQILRRMDDLVPGHPVQRFRFVVGRFAPPAPAPAEPVADEARVAEARPGEPPAAPQRPVPVADKTSEQDSEGRVAKEKRRDHQPAQGVGEAARAQAKGVEDERLRAAIEAALRRSSEEPPTAPGHGTPSG